MSGTSARSGLLQPADAGIGGGVTEAEIRLRNVRILFRYPEPPLLDATGKLESQMVRNYGPDQSQRQPYQDAMQDLLNAL
jgi:hypothetical protein